MEENNNPKKSDISISIYKALSEEKIDAMKLVDGYTQLRNKKKFKENYPNLVHKIDRLIELKNCEVALLISICSGLGFEAKKEIEDVNYNRLRYMEEKVELMTADMHRLENLGQLEEAKRRKKQIERELSYIRFYRRIYDMEEGEVDAGSSENA